MSCSLRPLLASAGPRRQLQGPPTEAGQHTNEVLLDRWDSARLKSTRCAVPGWCAKRLIRMRGLSDRGDRRRNGRYTAGGDRRDRSVLDRRRRGPAGGGALRCLWGRKLPASRDLPALPQPGHGPVESPVAVTCTATVNYQRWLPDLEVPYALVLVEFPEHPGAGRRTIWAPPGSGCVGWRSTSVSSRARRICRPELPRRRRRPEVYGHRRTASLISGVGHSAIGGSSAARASADVRADLAAVADAGLTLEDIDGLTAFPPAARPTFPATPTPISTRHRTPCAHDQLASRHGGGLPFYGAVDAVASGQARHVSCVGRSKRGRGPQGGRRPAYGSDHPRRGPPGLVAADRGAVARVPDRTVRHSLYARLRRQSRAAGLDTGHPGAHAAHNPDAVYRRR